MLILMYITITLQLIIQLLISLMLTFVKRIMSLTLITCQHQLQSGQAIPWYFITFWGGNWSGIDIRTILFCFENYK